MKAFQREEEKGHPSLPKVVAGGRDNRKERMKVRFYNFFPNFNVLK